MSEFAGIGGMVTALVGAIAAFPALHQWKAMRIRSKVKEDLAIWKQLMEAKEMCTTFPGDETSRREIQKSIDILAEKIAYKTGKLHPYREASARTDLDRSNLATGIVLLLASWAALRYAAIHPEKLGSWTSDAKCAGLLLMLTGIGCVFMGLRRVPALYRYSKLRRQQRMELKTEQAHTKKDEPRGPSFQLSANDSLLES